MKFQSFKSFAKYGLFFIFIISLVCTAYADPDQNLYQNGSTDNGNATVDNSGYGNSSINPGNTTSINSSVSHSVRGPGQGGIALSWDDRGHVETCYQYLWLFQNYNATCTMNVNGISNSQNTPPATLKRDLDALHSAGWEISTHGYNHEDSRIFLSNHTDEEWLDQEIFPNIEELTSYGYPVYTLSYPYSSRDDDTDEIVSPFFRTLRTRATVPDSRNVNETDLAYYEWGSNKKLLRGVEIDNRNNLTTESIEYGIKRAIDDGTVLVLYGHAIAPIPGDEEYTTSTARLEAILNYTKSNGGKFYHMGDLGDSNWVPRENFIIAEADFSVSTDLIEAGNNVTFEDNSINQTFELLDFGDNSTPSSTADVTHKYTAPGNYTANLTASNLYSSDSMTQTITVFETIPVAGFTSNSTNGPRPLSIAFTDTSIGYPRSWEWDFGDGTTSTEQNPVHEYARVGNYSVNLTATNEKGSNSTQKVNYITVLPGVPSANFQSSRTSGYAPLTVQFTDTSTGDPTSWNWNFGDGTTLTEKNPSHTYSTAGDYCVNLTASNAIGNSSKAATINVYETSSGGGGSSSGGGGGGGSPEPATNVQVKELSQTQVTNGKSVKFDFARNATCVLSVTFDAKKTAGKTTGTVEMLKEKSTLVSALSAGEVYKFFNLWIGNAGFATASNIANPVINFKVEKAWIKDKNIDPSSIALNRYSDKKWEQISASSTGEDNNYLYFSAKTPGFSFFGITGKVKETEIKPEPDSQETPKNISSEVPQKTATEQKTETSANKPLPGFELIYGVACLFAIFAYKRKY
jgi:PGF-pre-PGF domain-containing protein